MNKKIKPTNIPLQEIQKYYKEVPNFIYYRLRSMKEIYYIDNSELSEMVVRALYDKLEDTAGYVYLYNNQYYLFAVNESVIYHEINHIINLKTLLKEFKLNYLDVLNIDDKGWTDDKISFNFIYEFIAEYASTVILKRSNQYEYLKFLLAKKKFKLDENLAYYMGSCVALDCEDNKSEKIKKVGKLLMNCIILDGFKVVSVNTEQVMKIIKNLKQYLLE